MDNYDLNAGIRWSKFKFKSAEVRIEFEAGEEIYRRYTAVSPITIDDLS